MPKSIVFFLFAFSFFILVACGGSTPSPEVGQNLAVLKGCASCHSVDDTKKIASPWRGLYSSQVELADGRIVTADEAYIIESITDPNAKIVQGYTSGAMPHISLTSDEVDALVAYIKSVK